MLKTGINGSSRGEREVKRCLNRHRVTYFKETKFKECKGEVKSLPFDFSVYVNGELRGLIEFDGVQHYLPTFDNEAWDRVRAADEIKDKFCKDNNIPLLRIPFYKFNNIEDILTKFLLKIGAIKKTPRGGIIATEHAKNNKIA